MGKWIWIGLGVAILAVALVLGGLQVSRLFNKIHERAEATVRFIEAFDGEPLGQIRQNASELFHGDLSSFENLLTLHPRLGRLQAAGAPNCSWRSSHTTDQNDIDGEFVDCEGVAKYAQDPTVGYTIGWRREGETWKLYNLYFRSEVFDEIVQDGANKPQPRKPKPDAPPL